MGQTSNKFPLLKMPLDLSKGVDKEVFDIISGFKSGVEAKNFLCSAILYYARSPLVLSANVLTERLDSLSAFLKDLDFSYTGLQLEKILSKLDSISVVREDVKYQDVPTVSLSTMDSGTVSALTSLRDKFKV